MSTGCCPSTLFDAVRAAASDTGSEDSPNSAYAAELELGAMQGGQHDTQRTWPWTTAKGSAAGGVNVAVAARAPRSEPGCPTPRCEMMFQLAPPTIPHPILGAQPG